jgi:hypothetical protein
MSPNTATQAAQSQPTPSDWSDAELLAELIATAPHRKATADQRHRTAAALAEADARNLDIPDEVLSRWLSVLQTNRLAFDCLLISASAKSRSPQVLAALEHVSASPDARNQRLGASARLTAGTQNIAELAKLLASFIETGETLEFGHLMVAVERTGDSSLAAILVPLLDQAPTWAVYWLTRVLRRLTRHCPAPPQADWLTEADRYLQEVCASWAELDLSSPLRTETEVELTSPTRAEVSISDGRDYFALEPDDTGFSSWPEWEFSWCHDGQRLFAVGSVCSTCEVLLQHIGWPSDRAVSRAQLVRAEVLNVSQLGPTLLDALEPLLDALASGRYQLRLPDLPVAGVEWTQTWFYADDPAPEPPSVAIYQPLDVDVPALVLVGTQPASVLNPDRVGEFQEAISAGQRPAVIVAAHGVRRQRFDAEEPHDTVTGFVIDGHHKLAAYAACGVAARIILICDRTPRLPSMVPDPMAIFDELLARYKADEPAV